MEQRLEKFEWLRYKAPTLPVPEKAYGLCFDDNRDVILLYPEEDVEANVKKA